jgi:hypothetical protein
MRPRGRHAEHIREVRAIETMAQVQLDDLTIGGAQRGKRGAHHRAKVRLPIAGAGIGHRIGHPGRLIARRGDAGRQAALALVPGHCNDAGWQPAMALIAGHRKQPRPQAAGIVQPCDPR